MKEKIDTHKSHTKLTIIAHTNVEMSCEVRVDYTAPGWTPTSIELW